MAGDIRCAPEFKVFTNIHSTVVDPQTFRRKSFVDFEGDSCIIPPNSFAGAHHGVFPHPAQCADHLPGQKHHARCGIIVNVTPFEPEWEGYVTLEFSTPRRCPRAHLCRRGCAQVLFFESDKDDVCEVSLQGPGRQSTRASMA